jgi:HptB-dependent secretion and biofilm anti anti-sigma factor
MAVTCTVSPDQNRVDITITGRFDFSLHDDFRDAYRRQTSAGEYRVHLDATEYIDSSALGMLLLLSEHAESRHGRVVLAGPTPGVRRTLAIANFDKLFRIE